MDWLRQGLHVIAAMHAHHYECILLDLGLPDVQGDSLLASIRKQEPSIGVIVSSAQGGAQDRVRLLDIGADDYMVKPIDLGELCARVRAVSRRAIQTTFEADIAYGPLRLCPARHSVMWRDRPVAVTRTEYTLLEAFMRRRSQVLTRDQLRSVLSGWGEQPSGNAVEVHVHVLRRKFGNSVIQTVRGLGYQLGDPRHHAVTR